MEWSEWIPTFLTVPSGLKISSIAVDMKIKDQGWGNRKGHVTLRLYREGTSKSAKGSAESAAAPAASTSAAAMQDSESEPTKPEKTLVAEADPYGCALHEWAECNTLWTDAAGSNPNPIVTEAKPNDVLALWHIV
jgi:hypothetical protein